MLYEVKFPYEEFLLSLSVTKSRNLLDLYLQVQKLCHSPMAIMSKAAPILQDDHFVDMLPVAWELLLENDQELASAAGKEWITTDI
jgi:hypothetical protein